MDDRGKDRVSIAAPCALLSAVHLFFFCYYYIWHLLDLSFLYRVRQRMKRRSPYRRFGHITLLIVDQMGKFPRKQLLHT